jgi:S-adenosylmethionine synthetase
VTIEKIREGVTEEVIKKIIPAELMDAKTKIYINSTGRFVVGGPKGDCGMTGRKIIVDTYGGGLHGGGAFSGKDPSKVDRSASYMARYIAKNLVAAGLAEKLEIQMAYTIGVAQPVSVMIDTEGTSKISPDRISQIVTELFDLRPRKIIEKLNLLRPIYKKTACGGHFGRTEESFTWEKLDMVDAIRKAAGI